MLGVGERLAIVLLLAACCCRSVSGLEQDHSPRDANSASFHHQSWSSEAGIGAVTDIGQDTDGWLWLTTSTGVYRYDGFSFEPASAALGNQVRDEDILAALPSRSGGVWLSTRTSGMLFWRNGHLDEFRDRRCTPTTQHESMVEDAEGSLWFQNATGLSRLKKNVCQEIGSREGYPGGFVSTVMADREGIVWVRARSGWIGRWRPQGSRFDGVAGAASSGSSALLGTDLRDRTWTAAADVLRPATSEALSSAVRVHPAAAGSPIGYFTFAHDGALWTATKEGVRRFAQNPFVVASDRRPAGELFTAQQGLTSNVVHKIFEDREHDVWVGTDGGLDQFRSTRLHPLLLPEIPEHQFGVVVDGTGRLWTGNVASSVMQVLSPDVIATRQQTAGIMCLRRDRSGVVWAADVRGDTLWRFGDGRPVALHIPGTASAQVASFDFDKDDEPWISLTGGRTLRLQGGQWIDVSAFLAKKPGVLGAMIADPSGTLYFAFSNRIVTWNGREFHDFTYPEGPLNVSVSTMAVQRDHVWLAGRGGIDLYSRGQIHRMYFRDPSAPGRVSGVVETQGGELWINGFSGVTRVPATELSTWLAHPEYRVGSERFDSTDNLPGLSTERLPEPSIVQGEGDRLWIATSKGLAWVSPAEVAADQNRVAPHVELLSISSGDRHMDLRSRVQIPRNSDRVTFTYTATSLSVPGRVRFRFMLDGVDHTWQEAGSVREASYTKLPPGSYTFHVQAANEDGLWNTIGATANLFVPMAFYQRLWFKVVMVLLIAALLWLAAHLRLAIAMTRLKERMAERLGERERIAQELHDTLLQSVSGLSLHYNRIAKSLPASDPTREALLRVLKQTDLAMDEGRRRVLALRSAADLAGDLPDRLRQLSAQLQELQQGHIETTITGHSFSLGPTNEDEIFLIAREAMMNAVRHAQAVRIRVHLEYAPRHVCLEISDDGIGIDTFIIAAKSKTLHMGLSGMRDRARHLRASFTIESKPQQGTRICLKLPTARSLSPAHLLRRLQRT